MCMRVSLQDVVIVLGVNRKFQTEIKVEPLNWNKYDLRALISSINTCGVIKNPNTNNQLQDWHVNVNINYQILYFKLKDRECSNLKDRDTKVIINIISNHQI